MKNGADLLVDGLVRWGVRHLFGMPGSHSTAIYDAISRAGSIGTTLIRNEQAGAFAADGYARVTGQPGVVCTTAGPGATNALTGVAECWADSVPVLLLAGQVNSDALDRECGNYHEIDLEGIFRPVTAMVRDRAPARGYPGYLGRAFQAMTWGRPRPAALFLPQDLMRASCTSAIEVPAFPHRPEPAVPDEAIARAAEILARAERPIILAGGGALWSGAAARSKRWRGGSARPSSPRSTARACSTSGTRSRWAMPARAGAGMCCRTPTSCSPSAAGSPRS